MAIRVKTPDGGTATFPDDTPLATIEAAMKAKFGAAPASAPEAAPSMWSRLGDAAKWADETQRNVALGGLKGAGSLALTAFETTPTELARRSVNALARSAGVSTPPDQMDEFVNQARGYLKPTGTAQNIGAGVIKAAPSVALGALTGGASVPIQALLQAGLSAGQSEAPTPLGVAKDAALGGGAVVGSAALGKLVSKAGELGVREYIKALAPTKEAMKTTAQKIAPELVRRGVTGSLADLAETGKANMTATGETLRDMYSSASKQGVTVNTEKIANGLEALKRPFLGPLGPDGKPIVLHEGAVDAVQAIQDTLKKFGDKASPEELWKFRKVLDDVVSSSNGFTRPLSPQTATALARAARSSMQDALTKAVPGVAGSNADYALWKGLTDVATSTLKRKTGQSGIVGDVLRSGAAGALGHATLGPAGTAAAAVPYIYTRPTVRTLAAVGLDRMSNLAPLARVAGPATETSIYDLLGGQ